MAKAHFHFNEFETLLKDFKPNSNKDRIEVLLKDCDSDDLKKIFNIFFRVQKENPYLETQNIDDLLHQRIVYLIEKRYNTREKIVEFISEGIVVEKTKNMLMKKHGIQGEEIESKRSVLAC